MKTPTSDQQVKYICWGLFGGFILFAFGFGLWSDRHGPAANRLLDLRQAAQLKANRTSDAMRGLQLPRPADADRKKPKANVALQGRCLVVDLSSATVSGEMIELGQPRQISPYQAWLAEPWRAERPEDVDLMIWLEHHQRDDFGPDTIYLRDGKVVGTSGSNWDDNYRAKCHVTVTDRKGRTLRSFETAAQANNGPIDDLRSFEASTMREIAQGMGVDPWSAKDLAQLESRSYAKPK